MNIKRKEKNTLPKSTIQFAIYLALMESSNTIPISWLIKACKSKSCFNRYINELKNYIFNNGIYTIKIQEKDLLERDYANTYVEIGVRRSYKKKYGYSIDHIRSDAKTVNEKTHIEKIKRLIFIYNLIHEEIFDYIHISIYEEDFYEGINNFPKATNILEKVNEKFFSVTVRTIQRDIKEIKNSINLYKKMIEEF